MRRKNIFPLTAALRHLPLAGPRILPKWAPPAYSVLWSGAVFPNLCKAVRDCTFSPSKGRRNTSSLHLLRLDTVNLFMARSRAPIDE
jgi:hypothetical protein